MEHGGKRRLIRRQPTTKYNFRMSPLTSEEQSYADGTVLDEDEITAYECYEVNGDRASYTCIADPIGK